MSTAYFPPLYKYAVEVQRLIGYDENQVLFNIDDIYDFINDARDEVAAQGQCVRIRTPSSAQITGLAVTNPGRNYTSPSLVFSLPDAPSASPPFATGATATGAVSQIGGGLTTPSVIFGGAGYFTPVVSVSDPTGSGGAVTATLGPHNQTNFGEEEYPFAGVDLSSFPGVRAILSVRSISVIWANWQWSVSWVGFSKYQAMIRQYVSTFYAPPVWATQFGQGTAGSVLMYPLPDQSYQMTWDCLCLPIPLTDDTTYEVIPEPWTKAVKFYAAHLALMGRAAEVPALMPLALTYFNHKDGGLFQTSMRRARAFSSPGRVSSFYGRV